VKGISDLINIRGLINLDFADIRTVMKDKGMAIMGTGIARGDNRAVEAATQAISSPLLENIKIEGATGIIVNVTGGSDLSLYEVNEASMLITEAAHEDAIVIFGAVIDPTLVEEIRITVIATGFTQEDQKRAADLRPDLTLQTAIHQNMVHMQQAQQQAAQMSTYAIPQAAAPQVPHHQVAPEVPTYAQAQVQPVQQPQAPAMNIAPSVQMPAHGLPPITAVQSSVASYNQQHAPVVETVAAPEAATPLAPMDGNSASSRDLLMAKMKAFKESQDIKAKYSQPEQLSMDMEDPSLEEARRMAREVLSSPFSNQNLEVPAFIRKKQNFDLNKE
jgi:cell division protein FtsZ